MSYPASRLRRRFFPDEFSEIGPLSIGPDIEAQPYVPQFPAMPMQQPDSGIGDGLGKLAGAGFRQLMKMRSPTLTPQPGGNPLGDIQQKGARPKFLGLFKDGGRLKRPGDVAVVGDDGPELAVRKPGGETQVIPFNIQRLAAAGLAANRPPQPETPDAPVLNTTLSPRFRAAFAEQQTQEPTASVQPPPTEPPRQTLAQRFGLLEQGGMPQTPNTAGLSTTQGAAQPEPQGRTLTQRFGLLQPEGMRPELTERTEELLDRPAFGASRPYVYPSGERGMSRLQAAFDRDTPTSSLAPASSMPTIAGDPLTSPVATLPPEALEIRRRYTRPTFKNTGDERADLARYEGELEQYRNPGDRNGRLRSGGRAAGRFAVGTLKAGGSPIQAGINALIGLIWGGASPNLDERLDRDAEQGRVARRMGVLDGRAKDEAALDNVRAQTRLHNEQADYYDSIKPLEFAAKQEQARKRELLQRLHAMPSISPARHGAFLSEWEQAFGEPFDVDSYNNKKGNFTIRGIVTDPSKPQERHDLAINFATGETRDLGLSGYTVPRDAQGMSESDRRTDADRDRAFNALERQRATSNELQRLGLNLSRDRFDFSRLERDDRLSENARKEMGAAAKLRSEAEQAEMDARAFANDGMYTGDDGKQHQAKWAVQRYKSAQDKAEALRRQYFQTYGYLHAPDGGEMRMTMDEFRQLFPNAPNPSASAPSYGIVITDSTQPGTPHTNNYPPRRGAPRSPSSAAPSQAAPAQSKGRVARANFGAVRAQNPHLKDASDAEVEAALRAMGVEVY